jgi:preprotein translocase subunit SecG
MPVLGEWLQVLDKQGPYGKNARRGDARYAAETATIMNYDGATTAAGLQKFDISRMKLLLIIGILFAIGIVVFLHLRKPKPVDKSAATYTGEIEAYRGNKKLIVVFTASWASVWKLTAVELRKLDFTRFDLCILDDAVDRPEIKRHGITFLPTVALVEAGQLTKRVQNMTSIEQIKDW